MTAMPEELKKSRERALSLEGIAYVFKAFREHSDSFSRDNYLACARLLLLAVRKSELTEAQWSKFNVEDKKCFYPRKGASLVLA
ncbi:hypothetical protein [Pantoea agglomerans]|uniref:hypothetical protein n=1 Tax=Enterobacter agglomerans TaxID=549 RepID=UPI0016544749|nr:hypothetical protein [Pantoea agglomerans]